MRKLRKSYISVSPYLLQDKERNKTLDSPLERGRGVLFSRTVWRRNPPLPLHTLHTPSQEGSFDYAVRPT